MARIKYQEALGLEVKRGRPAKGNKPLKKEIIKLYVKESKSIREVAKELRCTKDMVARALIEYGIRSRSSVPRSSLIEYDLKTLEAGILTKGLRGFARDLGVNPSTLLHHMRVRKKQARERLI